MFSYHPHAVRAFQRRMILLMVALLVVTAGAGLIGPAPRTALAASATTTSDLNLRSGPSLDAAVLAVMPAGAAVEIVGDAEAGFYPVSYQGTRGYAFADFLSTGGGAAPVAAPEAGPGAGSAHTTADLNLRAGPNTSSDVLTVIPSGATVNVSAGSQYGFAPVTYGGTSGWAYTAYLTGGGSGSAPDPVPEAPSEPSASGSATTTADLNLRAGPNLTSDILAVMPYGATVTLTGRTQAGFYAVRHQGNDGWAHSDYLTLGAAPAADPAPAAPASDPPPAAAPAQGPTGTVYTTSDLNLRAGPSTSTSVLTVIPSGAAVTATGQSQAGFSSVSYNGADGWAHADYLTSSAPAQAPAPAAPAPAAGDAGGSAESDIIAIINAAADRYGQPRADMLRVARCESLLDPNAVNPAGSYGLFQFIPSTWASTPYATYDIFDPWASANAAAWMWSQGRRGEWTCQ